MKSSDVSLIISQMWGIASFIMEDSFNKTLCLFLCILWAIAWYKESKIEIREVLKREWEHK